MRTTLAISCLAGVVFASKSKNYRPKHTAVRPSGDCLTEEAWSYSSDTDCDQIWMDWDDSCWDKHSEDCDHAHDDVFGVPARTPAPDASCDSAYLLNSVNQVCNDAWWNFDLWCDWWGLSEDDVETCSSANDAYWAR